MSCPLDPFTTRTHTLLRSAQEEAQRHHHPYVGAEHLLLALLNEQAGLAPKVLTNLGIDLTDAYQTVELVIAQREREIGAVKRVRMHLPTPTKLVRRLIHKGKSHKGRSFNHRAMRVIDLAKEEAQYLKHHYVGTEHILLGLIREGANLASDVLVDKGMSEAKIRQEIIRLVA